MLTRRDFLKVGVASGTGLTFFWRGATLYARPTIRPSSTADTRAVAQIPGGTLTPGQVTKYLTPLLVPPAMPRAGKIKVKGGKNIDYYEIAMRQLQQQILPSGMPPTTVWGYGPKVAQTGAAIFNAPSLTIEAKANTPVRIKWINELVDAQGNYLPHLLPVDPTLHWANPPGGEVERDTRPAFSTTPGSYTGPVPIVTHVHGATGVGDESDGYAEAWYLPAANNIPSGYATTGTWYNTLKEEAAAAHGTAWTDGSATFQYPNANRASTLWYHDHALGMTRLNVYAGPAGFYIIRGGPSDRVLDTRKGKEALLPGPAPAQGDPPGMTYYEIPLAIQDRSFNSDGSLFYPDSRYFFDFIEGPYLPETDIAPIWNPEFFGNMIIVNGNTWPYHMVEQRRYRLRFLNGCQSRFLILDFNQITNVDVWMIGNEGGFLAAPFNLTTLNGNRLLIGPAERADMIVDFTRVPPGNYVLANVGPDEPFGGGVPGQDFVMADASSTGQIMQLRVVPATGRDATTPPQFLQLPALTPLPPATTTRPLALIEKMSEFFDGPAEALLGTVMGDPNVAEAHAMPMMWMDAVTENPQVGDTEIWEFYNLTADAHPMHVHEVVFEVLNRQAIHIDEMDETNHEIMIAPESAPILPGAWELGLKDTVIAYPGEVTRIRAQFNTPGRFVWHCHIVEHEDNEMMRPYHIGAGADFDPRLQMKAGSLNESGEVKTYMPILTNE